MTMNMHEAIINCNFIDNDVEHKHKKYVSKYLLIFQISTEDNIINIFNNKRKLY